MGSKTKSGNLESIQHIRWKPIRYCIFFLLLFHIPSLVSQVLSPIFKEGEFSGMIYQYYTDNDGYTWISTDQGVYRWDTKTMEHFTTADGLPHNEVFKCYQDTRKRVWMTFYSGEVCYYYRGKIYNKEIDIRLKKFPPVGISGVLEANNSLYFFDKTKDSIPKTIEYDSLVFRDSFKIKFLNFNAPTSTIQYYNSQVITYNVPTYSIAEIYNYSLQEIIKHKYLSKSLENTFFLSQDNIVYRIHQSASSEVIEFSTLKPDFVFSDIKLIANTQCFLGYKNNKYYFLKEKEIYSVDSINNIQSEHFFTEKIGCFGTEGSQKFLLNNKRNRLYKTSLDKLETIQSVVQKEDIHKLFIHQGSIWTINKDFTLENTRTCKKIKLTNKTHPTDGTLYNYILNQNQINIANSIGIISCSLDNEKSINTSKFEEILDHKIKINSFLGIGVKYIFFYRGAMFSSSVLGLFCIENNLAIRLSNEKCTSHFIDNKNRLWISQDDGIYYTRDYEPKVTHLKKVQTGLKLNIQAYDYKEDRYGNILMATNQGVLILDSREQVYHISSHRGLTGEDCRKIEIDNDGSLWIATNNGLNHFQYWANGKFSPKSINFFLKDDGISSNNIRDFVLQGDSLYIATDKGLDLVKNKHWKPSPTGMFIHINRLYVGGKQIDSFEFPSLNHTQNSLQIDFSAIYYDRTDRMKVFYRLIAGSDTSTQELKERSILLQSLAPNAYTLQIYAYDQDYPNIQSNIQELKFTISPPFYKTWWFILLMLLTGIGIAALVIYLHYSRNKEKLEHELTRVEMEKDLSRFKLEALKAEMNPHFIFNCLNSIKDFILKSDIENSQYYLAQLSKLIRIALYNAKEEFISLRSELEFVSLYVELEQLRFNHQFDFVYEVENPTLLNAEIPTMILQPFFENAIRHGKIGQLDYQGKLLLKIFEENQRIVFQILDNGIGMEESAKIKEQSHSTHKSMALGIINERIKIYNHSYGLDIEMSIVTLENSEYKTMVEIKYILD